LYADHALAGCVNSELAEVADDPFATQFFRYGSGGAGATKEISDKVAFVGRGFDDSFKQGFGFLSGV